MSDGIFLRRCGTRCLKTIGGETEKTAKNGVPRNRKAGWRVISSCRSARRAPSCVDSAPAVLCKTFAGLSPCCSTQALSVPPNFFFFFFFFSRFSRKEVSAHHWVRLAGVLAKSFDPLC